MADSSDVFGSNQGLCTSEPGIQGLISGSLTSHHTGLLALSYFAWISELEGAGLEVHST